MLSFYTVSRYRQAVMQVLGIDVSTILSGIFSSSLVILALRVFGSHMLSSFLQRREGTFRHELSIEFEKLKTILLYEIEKQKKQIDIEYDIFPRLWVSTVELYSSVVDCCSRFRQYKDVRMLNEEGLREALQVYDFSETENIQILQATRDLRQEKFQKMST